MEGRQCRNEPAMECPWEWGAKMRKLFWHWTDTDSGLFLFRLMKANLHSLFEKIVAKEWEGIFIVPLLAKKIGLIFVHFRPLSSGIIQT